MATLRERLARFATRAVRAASDAAAPASDPAPSSSCAALQLEELESRMLMSADLPGLEALLPALSPEAAALEQVEPAAPPTAADASAAEPQRREIVFLDTGVEGYELLLEDLRSRAEASLEVVLLDAQRDGVAQISEALARSEPGLDAVHVVSHGTESGLRLGDAWLTADSLGGYAESLRGWSGALAEGADLLLYGCDLAASESGRGLVADLAALTGADVAASIDATGAAALGGDWELEHRQGQLETGAAFSAEARAAFLGVLDGMAIWNPAGAATPEVSELIGASFNPATATSNVGGPWRILDGAGSPHRDEILVVGMDDSRNLSGQIWDGATWTPFAFNDIATDLRDDAWSFAVAYESQSGRAMLVYANGNDGVNGLEYRMWDGTTWSGPTIVSTPESGEPVHMRLAASPDSNEMVLVVSNEDKEDYALVWDGASWGNAVSLDDGSGSPDNREVSVVYEQQSGDAMVVYGDDGEDARYRTWNGSSWSAAGSVTRPAGASGPLLWSRLAADPASDRIALGAVTSNGDTWLAVWDGGSWAPSQLATNNAETTNAPNVAVAFEGTSGQVIAAYGDSGSNQVRYQTWSAGVWSGDLAGPNLGDQASSLLLASEAGSDSVMLAVQDSSKELSYVLWNGSAWGAPDQLESDTGESDFQPFTFLWEPSNAAPVLTPAAPTLATISSRVTDGAGQLIASIVGSSITDTDVGAREGIAINLLASGSGTWEYSLDGGSTWLDVGSVTDNSALLLRDSDRIRFVPGDTDAPDTASFQYRAWDQTFGSAGSKFDVSSNGGATAYSAAEDTASITVTNANHGVAIWGQSGSGMPEVNSFDGAAFGTAGFSANVDGPWRHIDVAHAPTRVEQIAVGVDPSGNLSGEMWDGSSWTALPFNDIAGLSVTSRSFAVAYEQQSGRLMLVYGDGTTGTSALSYRIWDGETWSAETTFSIPHAGEAQHLRLAAKPDSDEMVLVVSNQFNQDYAVVWNGASWGNAVALHDGSGALANVDVHVVYEQQSGDAMVVYGRNSNDLYFQTWNGSSWSGPAVISAPGSTSQAIWTKLAADPTSDRIALGVVSSDQDTWLAVWDGSSWSSSQTATSSSPPISYASVDVAFEAESGTAIAVYGKLLDNTVYYRTFSGSSWSPEQTGPALGGWATTLTLDADPGSDAVMLGAQDVLHDLTYVLWDGSDWIVQSRQETNLGTDAYQPFAFLWEPETQEADSLLLTTNAAVTAGGQPGEDTWQDGDLIAFSEPSLALDPGPTSGTVTVPFDIDLFAPGAKLTGGIHYVSRDLQVGASSFQLLEGDLLLATDSTETLTSTSLGVGAFTNNLTVGREDVFVFRPDVVGNYSAGTFAMLLDDMAGPGISVHGISLVEQDTWVGDKLLAAGDFLYLRSGIGDQDDVWLFETATVGAGSTSGGSSVLLEASDTDLSINKQLNGIELVETATTLGDRILPAGSLLLAVDSTDTVGKKGLSVTAFDIFALDVAQTTLVAGAGNADATASLLFEGGDVAFDDPSSEKIHGISLFDANDAPELTPRTPRLTDITEDDTANAGKTVASFVVDSIQDTDTGAVEGIAVTNLVSGNGTWEFDVGSGWTPIGAVSDGGALLLRDTDRIRFVPDTENGETVSFDFRAWDQTSGSPGSKANTVPNGGASAFSTATDTATLEVTDLNDLPSLAGFTTGLAENSANGTAVGSVTGSDVDNGGNGVLTYAITGGNTSGAFVINASTGVISVANDGALDFESTPTFNLTVKATDGGSLTDTASVTVNLADANELPGVTGFTTGLAENSANGTAVGTVAGSDPDAGANGTLTYAITAGNTNGAFTINAATGAITVANDGALDFESTPVLNLTVTATDGGSLTDTASVTVNLADANELPGVTGFTTGLTENSANGTAVGTVAGSDPDAGANGTLTYAITAGNTNGAFTINASTGAITVANDGALDFEATPAFNLTVRATDGGALSDTASVTVNLSDANETPSVTGGPFGLAENSANGTAVGTVAGSDPDAGANGTLTYAITAGNTNGAFTINAATGAITVANDGALDFETTPAFNLTVTATDGGSLSDTASVTVNLSDANEAPSVTGGPFGLAEDSPNGTAVGSVTGADPDAGANGTLTYAITAGNTNGAFTINASTGAITVANDGALDFEATPAFNLTVRATDGGALSDTASVTVNLSDANETPSVTGGPFGLAENSANGTAVGTVAGSDPDAGANGTLTYAITAGNTNGAFTINTATGAITVANDGALDFESTPTFNLTVTAADGGSLSDTASVTVNLSDGNETPSLAGFTAGLAENSANGTAVGSVTGTDPDAGANGVLTYSLTGGNTNGAFAINATTGAVTVANGGALDFETTPVFNLSVTVSDGGGLTDTAAVTVNLGDVNDAPKVAGGPFAVTESSANGTLVGSVSGSDDDPGANGVLTYAITAGNSNGAFTINTSTGAISVANDGALDFEATPVFSLTVRATDGGALSDTASVTVNLLDGNESPSVTGFGTNLVENSPNGTAVGAVTGSDPDAGVNGTLTYSLTSGNTNGAFAINASTGAITVANEGALDFETTPVFNLSVTVNDGGTLTDTAAVTVNLLDGNDAPVMSPAAPSLTPINEDEITNPGQQISTILGASVSDVDVAPLEGIAITAIHPGNGQWQFSTDGGGSWAPLLAASDASALLLRDSDFVRFVPNAANGTLAGFDYRAWDRSDGALAGSTASTLVNGGATAYSVQENSASIDVSSVNDAPSLADAMLVAPPPETPNPPGETIAALFAAGFADVDAGASLAGIAVIGNTADPLTQGVWQYSSDGGANWAAVGSVADDGTALALSSGSRLRFLPVEGYSGTPPVLLLRGLDDSYPGAFSSTLGGFELRAFTDASLNGGTSAVSASIAQLSTGFTVAPPPAPEPPADPPAPEPAPEPDPPASEEEPPAPSEEAPAPVSHSGGSTTPPAPEPPPAPLLPAPDPPAPAESPAPSLDTQPEDLLRAVVEHYTAAPAPGGSAEELAVKVFEDQRQDFLEELDEVRDELEAPLRIEARVVGSAVAMTTGLSVGYVIWLTRGGLLLASLLSSMPAWRIIDPLPVLARFAEEDEADQETLESMIQGAEGPEAEPEEPEPPPQRPV